MGQTYEQHKATVDAANPTPAVTWHLHGEDLPHIHDDYAVADTCVMIDGVETEFELHYNGLGAIGHFSVLKVTGEESVRVRQVARGSTWPECKTAFATWFEAVSEAWRASLATEAYARDILTDDGITYGVMKLTGLTANAAAIGNVPFTPPFDPDVLAYTASTTLPGLTITAVLPEDAAIEWVHGTNAAIATASASFTLTTGENVITVTVSRPEYTPTTYTLTVTRA